MQVRVGFWVTFKHLTQISLYVVFFYLKFAFKMQIIYLKVILIEAEEKKYLYLLFYQNRIMCLHIGNTFLSPNSVKCRSV